MEPESLSVSLFHYSHYNSYQCNFMWVIQIYWNSSPSSAFAHIYCYIHEVKVMFLCLRFFFNYTR